ncbi:hypothetical protein Psi02_33530 [Planotetraspora silvatica]|uniref:Uncharacterized protein n=1 Tax=Planotetraspora silvatica TaxID=234614 RepID=A0A8J3UJJ2_9ACTN|nr:hypothetical protein Psi02_33530 [Planotetraspora silvatica]
MRVRLYQELPVTRQVDRLTAVFVRVVLLVVLLWGTLLAFFAALPQERSAAEFHAKLYAGQVSAVIYRHVDHDVDLRWSTSPFTWYHSVDPNLKHGLTNLVRPGGTYPYVVGAKSLTHPRWLAAMWTLRVPDSFGWLVMLAWIISFVMMLRTKVHRVGNRWAWFWLFTFGQIGAVLYLLLEPRSLWWGVEPQEPPANPLGGVRGIILSFCVAATIAVSFEGWLGSAAHAVVNVLAAL